MARALVADPEPIGHSAWALRGGLPRHGINVFFLREGDGVAMFDAGSREMAGELRRLAAPLGGIGRVVLSHGHPDHRGTARTLGLPVFCHPDEVSDAEGDGGRHYGVNSGVGPLKDRLRGKIMLWLRDAGPVQVAGTISEGGRVGAYEVLDLPGHAPGQIGLWSESERILISGDCFYTLDERTARLPKAVFNHDPGLAVASVRRIIDLRPRVAWPGHGRALVGDVAGALEAALAA